MISPENWLDFRYAYAMDKKPRATTTRDSDKYIIRFIDGLKDRIEGAAAANNRSINAEINSRLQQSFDLEPMKASKREELTRMVNEAIDERIELEKQRAEALLQTPPAPVGAKKPKPPSPR